MKKIALAVILLTVITLGKAQSGNNICVWNAMNTYSEGGSPNDLESAIKCSDEAIANENTMNQSKTWFYRGKLYRLIYQDTVLHKKYGTASMEGIKAFKKLYDLADPKFKDWDEVATNLYILGQLTFNEGVDQYQHRNYAQAFQSFYSIKDVNAILEGKKKEPNINLGTALKYAAQSAENAGDKTNALKAYTDWVQIAPSAMGYQRLSIAFKNTGDTVQAKKTIDDGLAKYPTDAALLVEKINFFLEQGKYTDALGFVNNLLAVEPNNDKALFIKALAYDKMGKEDSVVYYYTKAIEINPKYADSYINLAAVYVNKARDINEQMNKLGNTSADVKKYNELNGEIKVLYTKALPYLNKAKELEPKDIQLARTLTQINSFLESNK